jgi:hypothetical protein
VGDPIVPELTEQAGRVVLAPRVGEAYVIRRAPRIPHAVPIPCVSSGSLSPAGGNAPSRDVRRPCASGRSGRRHERAAASARRPGDARRSGARGVRREKLAACLWSDSAEEQARHALEQLLYSTRQQIAVDPFLGGNPLRLNPAVIASDVGEFDRALVRGALAEAIALHAGPFLDGFFLKGAGEFAPAT